MWCLFFFGGGKTDHIKILHNGHIGGLKKMQKNQKIQKVLSERHKPATFSDEEICEIDDVIENMTDLHEYGISNWYPSIEDINTRILNKKKIEKL